MEWFNKLTLASFQDFKDFTLANEFGDTAFSLSYAWAERFNYCYVKIGDCVVVCGRDINNTYGFYIIRKEESPIDEAGDYILKFCRSRDIIPAFEFIHEKELDTYRDFAKKRGLNAQFDYSDTLSDYIYRSSDYISVKGSANKTKRGSINNLLRKYPNLKYITLSKDEVASLNPLFIEWCSSRCCADCHYGCELRAFSRFLELYDPSKHIIRAAVSGGDILSFFVGEITNPRTICCYFQKSSRRIRGITYWLSRCVMEEYSDMEYLNLGEDMGISGIRNEKSLLHPYMILKKYSMIVRSELV